MVGLRARTRGRIGARANSLGLTSESRKLGQPCDLLSLTKASQERSLPAVKSGLPVTWSGSGLGLALGGSPEEGGVRLTHRVVEGQVTRALRLVVQEARLQPVASVLGVVPVAQNGGY